MDKRIIKHITNPLWERAAGRNRLGFLSQLEKSQWWETGKLSKLQDERLRSLIEHAYANVPYYNEVFKSRGLTPSDIKTAEDLRKLPILTKDIIADNFESLKARNMDRFKPKYYTTGGTSGRHLHFFNAQATFDAHMAASYRAWRWCGWDFGERYAHIWGASMDLKDESTIKKKVHTYLTENRYLMQALMFTDETLERDTRKLVQFRPDFIISYPSALIIVVRFMKSRARPLRVKAVITSSEKLFPWQRQEIEEYFGCRIHDDYGGRESSIRATQCEKVEGYHISVENGVLETVRDGNNVHGKPGRVLLTEFHNYAMPLIRYENTDVATLSEKTCACGRTLPLLERIEGRVSDIFVTADGKYIPAEYFMVAFLGFTGEFYQVIQESKEKITIKIVKGKHFRESNLKDIEKTLRQWLGDRIKIDFQFHDDIPLSPSGKRRYFMSKVPLGF